jgi:predicted ribosomally synthesized peptide with nif11-like leader
MSTVTEFYQAFSKDEAMQQRVKARSEAVRETDGQGKTEAIIAFAAEEGYSLTAEDLKDFMDSTELSDDMLKAVTGGGCGCSSVLNTLTNTWPSS